MPVLILNSQFTDEMAGDKDMIPPNGNPHPIIDHIPNMNQEDHFPGHFEDVGDLNQVLQEILAQGMEHPPQEPHHAQNQGWNQWIQ